MAEAARKKKEEEERLAKEEEERAAAEAAEEAAAEARRAAADDADDEANEVKSGPGAESSAEEVKASAAAVKAESSSSPGADLKPEVTPSQPTTSAGPGGNRAAEETVSEGDVASGDLTGTGPLTSESPCSPRPVEEEVIQKDTSRREPQINVSFLEDDRGSAADDHNVDEDDDSERRDDGPLPLGVQIEPLNLPAPDLSAVIPVVASPTLTPIPTPRKRPSIVGIGGLSVSADVTEEERSLMEAIEVLREDMCGERRSHPGRASFQSENSPLETQQDIEDFNNRLVLKLPPRRKSSVVAPPPRLLNSQLSHDGNNSSPPRPVSAPYTSKIQQSSADSDEGIGLAEEELIEKSVYMPCSGQPPNSMLRISLPNDQDLHSDDEWGGAASSSRNVVGIKIDLSDVETGGGWEEGTARTGRRDSEQREGRMSSLGVTGLTSDTPRSVSRSEVSGLHVSLASPRSEYTSTDCDEPEDEDRIHYSIGDGRISRGSVGRTILSARSNPSSQHDCDADSVLLSLHELETEAEDTERQDTEEAGEGEKSALSSRASTFRQKNAHVTKRSLSCQRIELKELNLNSPVTADQFSNRQKFGAVPRNFSKFLVLGKSSKLEEPPLSAGHETGGKPRVGSAAERTAMVNRQPPSMITPTLRWESSRRPLTAAVTSRERNVLQQRRIRLLADEMSPMEDTQRQFDLFPLPESIQIPTERSVPSEQDMIERVKHMERKILKRSQTSSDFQPTLLQMEAKGSETTRSEASTPKIRASSASSRRHLSSAKSTRSQDKRVSIVDLSKSLRRDNAVKSNASVNRRHSGFKSIVPLARVVMAYQSVRRRRQSSEFYSISRRLEKSGVPYQSAAEYTRNAYAVPHPESRLDKRKKKKKAKKSNSGATRQPDGESLVIPPETDVPTLVGDLDEPEDCNDPDLLHDDVVFEKVRTLSSAPVLCRRSKQELPLAGVRGGNGITQSSVVTLEIPNDSKYERKLKSVSLLSKLPIK